MQAAPIAVEVIRGDIVESVHRVHLCVSDPQGNLFTSLGNPEMVTYLRSAAKPFQAAALVVSGAADAVGLTPRELALLCGSHAGEPAHVEAAESVLKKAGLTPDALQCGTHRFWNKRNPGTPTPSALTNNCSGKHAGMLLLQKHLGGPVESYLDPGSPAQLRILGLVAETAGVPASDIKVAVDGCGAPTFALPMSKAALLFARLAMPRGVSKETADALDRVRKAMLFHPDMVGGAGRFDTELMDNGEERLVSKAGAEGYQAVADLASGLGLALKVEDGALRPVAPATIEALRQLGWLETRAFEPLGEWWMPPVKNHAGKAVGRLKPVLVLDLPSGGLHG